MTLAPLTALPAAPARLLAAVHLRRTRLIDNVRVART
jgi:pantothenate synthetase